MLLSKQLLNMCALFKNVGKVITTQNSGRQPVQREFSLSLSSPVASAETRPQESSGGLVHGHFERGSQATKASTPDVHLLKTALASHIIFLRRESYGEG